MRLPWCHLTARCLPRAPIQTAPVSFIDAYAAATARLNFVSPPLSNGGRTFSAARESRAVKGIREKRLNPLAALSAVAPGEVEEVVDNILYNTPAKPTGTTDRHILTLLVSNETGVLSRISGVIAARGFNIDSIVVCKTEVAALSRMTIVLKGQSAEITQAKRQLEDLVPVWAVLDYAGTPIVERELVLLKVQAMPPSLSEFENFYTESKDDSAAGRVGGLSPILAAGMHRQTVIELAKVFGAKVEDISHDAIVLELTAPPYKVDSFVKMMKPYGLIEVVRSGCMAVPRSPVEGYEDGSEDDAAEKASATVDASQLPPG
ncbi:hypothetical protein HDU83_004720 [Entophlyctis luteolus]|nr:hypothetical protein HDU82_007078 [Entophlyctis luteolus]KAJ3344825.1 hypothetical protein HDU83_004720 [Entophlyctis luteolus]